MLERRNKLLNFFSFSFWRKISGVFVTKPEAKILPYRACAGIMLLNKENKIFIGRRFVDFISNEIVHRWQMPQGGIDPDEDISRAAFRELHEETGIRNAEIIGITKDWILYDLPPEAVGIALKGKYRGQRQKWVAMRFKGGDDEIDLQVAGQEQEFDDWRWATREEALAEIVAFKRAVYEAVFLEFAELFAERR